jgi:hypothetical protein
MKTLFIAAALTLLATPVTAGDRYMRQTCTGFIQGLEKGFELIPDENQKCIDAELNAKHQRQILRVCKISGRCRIEGWFEGHGVFFWTKITNVKRLRDCISVSCG